MNFFSPHPRRSSRVEVDPKDKISLTFNNKEMEILCHAPVGALWQSAIPDGGNATDPFRPVTAANAFKGNALEITDQTFSAKTVTDLSLSYDITRSVTATIGANNLSMFTRISRSIVPT